MHMTSPHSYKLAPPVSARQLIYILLLLSGCSLFESDRSEVRLSLQGNPQLLREVIQVQLTASNWTKTLKGTDFQQGESPNSTKAFETPRSGSLRVDVTLRDSANGHVNSASITLDLRSDWRWGVDIFLSDKNPLEGCFGCLGAKAFPVDSFYQSTPLDSLYIVWGGNSIKHPVVY